MEHQEILRKAIKKAIDNGWDNLGHHESIPVHEIHDIEHIIYNKKFAKALWGEHEMTTDRIEVINGLEFYEDAVAWQYHLQQMVIAKDPLKYLEENI